MNFIEETEIAERSLRRLAASRGTTVVRSGNEYTVLGVTLTDDEAWSVLSEMPRTVFGV